MYRHLAAALAAWALVVGSAALAKDEPKAGDDKGDEKEQADQKPEPASSVTQHQVTIEGQVVKYTATAGWLIMKDDKDKPIARFGYTAYTRDGVKDLARRPIMFAYNGGPGSSSIWLHMGIMGPRRVVVNDQGYAPPPPSVSVDNAYTVLDVTDIVMVDPVGTGFSKPLGDAKAGDFWGVDQDIKSVGQFIKRYVSDNGRWASPKYLLGESYGGMRSAGLAYYLQNTLGMDLNGVVLVSPFMNAGSGIDGEEIDLPHVLYLPTFAATAWYHDAIANKPASLPAYLEEVERFAYNEYAPALMRGYVISDAEKKAVAAKLAAYTGTTADYWEKADLRVSHPQFLQELKRSQRLDRGPHRLALPRAGGEPAHRDDGLRPVLPRGRSRLHRRVPRLPALGAQVRQGRELRGLGVRHQVGLEAQAAGRRRLDVAAAKHGAGPRAGDDLQPGTPRAGAAGLLRPRHAVARHEERCRAPRHHPGGAQAHHHELLRRGAHDVPARALDEEVPSGRSGLRARDRSPLTGMRIEVHPPAAPILGLGPRIGRAAAVRTRDRSRRDGAPGSHDGRAAGAARRLGFHAVSAADCAARRVSRTRFPTLPHDRLSHAYGKSFADSVRMWNRDVPNPPDWVAFPRDEQAVADILDWAGREDVAVVPYGGGSSVCGGVEPAAGAGYRATVSLDLERLDRVLDVDRASRSARIQAGILGPELESGLRPHGLTLRHFPQSFQFSTLGGWIVTRSGGHYATLVHAHRRVRAGRADGDARGRDGDTPAARQRRGPGSEPAGRGLGGRARRRDRGVDAPAGPPAIPRIGVGAIRRLRRRA